MPHRLALTSLLSPLWATWPSPHLILVSITASLAGVVFPSAVAQRQRHRAVVMIRRLLGKSALQVVESADPRIVLAVKRPITEYYDMVLDACKRTILTNSSQNNHLRPTKMFFC